MVGWEKIFDFMCEFSLNSILYAIKSVRQKCVKVIPSNLASFRLSLVPDVLRFDYHKILFLDQTPNSPVKLLNCMHWSNQ